MMNTRSPARVFAVALVTALAAAACKEPSPAAPPLDANSVTAPHGDENATTNPGANPGTNAGTNAGTNTGANVGAVANDGEVAAVLAAADTGEIQQGELATTHATDARVRDFGRMMITEHTASSQKLTALRQRLDLSPQESVRSRALTSDATATRERLSGLRGADFDRAYVEAQVAQHTQVLETIDSALLPAVREADLRAAITNDVRPMVAAHLQRARDLQAALSAPNQRPAGASDTTGSAANPAGGSAHPMGTAAPANSNTPSGVR